MRFDILTLFPEMCKGVLDESIIGRAQKSGAITVSVRNIRDYSLDKHGRVDDYPYGGGRGMVMAVQPIKDAVTAVENEIGEKPYVIYMSPKGRVLTQSVAQELAKKPNITVLCGHYEGVDQRVLDLLVDEEISAGDYVLTGGELPALILVDCVSRLVDGVLGGEECYEDESIQSGVLEYPQYTRPAEYEGMKVPEVLLSGHDKNIRNWRRKQSLLLTKERRPDLYEKIELSKEDLKLLND